MVLIAPVHGNCLTFYFSTAFLLKVFFKKGQQRTKTYKSKKSTEENSLNVQELYKI